MESFLYQVASRIFSDWGNDMGNVTVVFNNRRAGLFLRNQFANICHGTHFLPNIIGIDDLVTDLTQLKIVSNEALIFELFDIHSHLESKPDKYLSFEDFLSFGEMMLNDFSQLDLYLVDSARIFDNLHEMKVIGEWNLDGQPLTPFQEQYLAFYRSLFSYYSQLRTRLFAANQAYSGMAYRHLAESIDSMIDDPSFSRSFPLYSRYLYFVGFNALSASENKIVSAFVSRSLGSLLCDGDKYYFDDANSTNTLSHEAGLFLRRLANQFADIKLFDEHFALNQRSISIINCPENVLQAKTAGSILKSIISEASDSNNLISDTALVLADESLLLPVLNSLPPEIHTANVTMGFPFTHTAFHTLTLRLFKLFSKSSPSGFYYQDLLDLFADGLFCLILDDKLFAKHLQDAFLQDKLIFIPPHFLNPFFSNERHASFLLSLFSSPQPSLDSILIHIHSLLQLFVTLDLVSDNPKEQNAIVVLSQILAFFSSISDRYNYIQNLKTLTSVYNRLARIRSVPFYGEPLSGLQCLGMLETRSLDFKNVILLSANESVLPASNSNNSLIPISLKRVFGLPTFEEQDAVFAYHFYRLIQRAENVWILYNSDSKADSKGEPSRFILQIKHELPRRYPNIHVTESVVALPFSASDSSSLFEIPKNDDSMSILHQKAISGFAPSALNVFRNCSLRFYYEYVLGIRTKEELSENLEFNEVGDFIHKSLEDIYNNAPKQGLTIPWLDESIKNFDTAISERFKGDALKGRIFEGKNFISFQSAKLQISNFLINEKSFLSHGEHHIQIIGLETTLLHDLSLPSGATASIKGTIDRVDILDGVIRILDYKSGSVLTKELNLSLSDASPLYVQPSDKWFQVMTYAWLYFTNNSDVDSLIGAIAPLKRTSTPFLPISWNNDVIISHNSLNEFSHMLTDLVDDIMNPNIPFHPTPSDDYCKYCPMYHSCNKSIC